MPTHLAGRGNTLELASGSSPPPLIVLIHPPKEKPKAVDQAQHPNLLEIQFQATHPNSN